MAAGNRRLILRPIDSIVQAVRRDRHESARLFLMNIDLAALPDEVGALQRRVYSEPEMRAMRAEPVRRASSN